MKYCKNCGKELPIRNNVYCSEKCSKLTPELAEKIDNILKRTYIRDANIIMSKTGAKAGKRMLDAYSKKFPEKWEIFLKTRPPFFVATKVQKLEPDEFDLLIEDLKILSYAKIVKKWNIGVKTLIRLFNFYCKDLNKQVLYLSRGEFKRLQRKSIYKNTRETYIETLVRAILISSNIKFSPQKYIVNLKFRCDFLLDNKKVIEVNGNYWHGNPEIYTHFDEKQKKSMANYEMKKEYYKNNDYKVLEIWETELNQNLEKVIQDIKNYANS